MSRRAGTGRHLGILVVVALVAFWNVFPNALHLDDAYRVEKNPGVQVFWPPWRHFAEPETSSRLPRLVQYRPLLPLSLSINYAIAGDSVIGYHVGNLLLHLAAVVLVYFLCRELWAHWGDGRLEPARTAFWTALVFAVHPVSGYLVNYVCSRDLLMMQVFLVASLWSYVRLRRLGDTPLRWGLCLGFLLLSLCAKKNAVALPGVLILFEVLLLRSSWRQAMRVLPVVATVGGFLLFVRYGLRFSDLGNIEAGTVDRWSYLWHQLQHHTFHYLRNFVWPVPLRAGAVDALSDVRSAIGLVVLIGALALAGWNARRRPWVAFCILGYLVLIALTSSIIPLHDEIVGYRPYPGSPFLYLLLVGLVLRRRWGGFLLGGFVVYLVGMSMLCNSHWRTEPALWQHAIDHGGSTRAYYNLALKLPDEDPRKRPLFETSLAMAPQYVTAHIGLAMMQIRTGEAAAGVQRLQHAVALAPSRGQSHYWLAEGLFLLRRFQEALNASLEAVKRQPRSVDFLYMVGRAAFAARRPQPILEYLPRLQRIKPDHLDTVFMLGAAHQMLGNNQPAVSHYLHYLQRNPSRTEIHRYIAECLDAAGDAAGAARHRELFRQHQQRSKKKN